jgi:hypothetical protein
LWTSILVRSLQVIFLHRIGCRAVPSIASWPRPRKAAKRHVRDNSAKIAKALLNRSLEGDMPSAKMLASLVGKPAVRKPKKSTRGHSLALDLDLASGPQYPPEEDEESGYYDSYKPPAETDASGCRSKARLLHPALDLH